MRYKNLELTSHIFVIYSTFWRVVGEPFAHYRKVESLLFKHVTTLAISINVLHIIFLLTQIDNGVKGSGVVATWCQLLLGAPANQRCQTGAMTSSPVSTLGVKTKSEISPAHQKHARLADLEGSPLRLCKNMCVLRLAPRCVQRRLGGASVCPSGQWRMGMTPCLWSGAAVMGA